MIKDVETISAPRGHAEQSEDLLAQQAEELRRSNTDLEMFASIASHDLQEPLRTVSSYVQLLERRYASQLDDDAREFIRYAVDGCGRMHTLINDLLTYARVGTRGKPLEATDCEAVLTDALSDLQRSIEDAQATITHDQLPSIPGDRAQLRQVFINLIGNAVKFRGNKAPRIHVSAEQQEGNWLFCVRDGGIGIAPEYHDRVFVIFQRLHGRDEYAGTGIGLAVCKKIIERHGGNLWVESQLGKGCTFYFTLPAQPVAA
ncbi:MAG: ATP-binding protein [Dehalococcoidia bacterium]